MYFSFFLQSNNKTWDKQEGSNDRACPQAPVTTSFRRSLWACQRTKIVGNTEIEHKKNWISRIYFAFFYFLNLNRHHQCALYTEIKSLNQFCSSVCVRCTVETYHGTGYLSLGHRCELSGGRADPSHQRCLITGNCTPDIPVRCHWGHRILCQWWWWGSNPSPVGLWIQALADWAILATINCFGYKIMITRIRINYKNSN